MAIDTRRKRASAAVIGLAFLAPSIVPDGSISASDRQAIAHSYYTASDTQTELGATSQLGLYTSSGGIALDITLGSTAQIGDYSSLGGITVTAETLLGGISQIGVYGSSGDVTIERILGGTTQLGSYGAAGGLTLEIIIGDTSQISAYSSSGELTNGTVQQVTPDRNVINIRSISRIINV